PPARADAAFVDHREDDIGIADIDREQHDNSFLFSPPFVSSEVETRAPGWSLVARPSTSLGTNGR
ncbi:MAG: hypothetical protein K2Y20_14950, partial [Sphingomonas sp.]|nr:hypothetical protein [Sphingomonas sp.]